MESSLDEDGQLKSVLYANTNGKQWTQINEVVLDLSKENYKETVNFAIEDLANSLKEKYDAKTVAEYDRILNELPELLYEGVGGEDYSKNSTVLSFFYHLSTIKSAKRAYAMDLDNCNCNTYPSYLGDESPFLCLEDNPISTNEILNFIKEKIMKVDYSGRQFIPTKTIKYLKQSKKEYLPVSDIDLIIRKEFNDFWTNTLTKTQRARKLLETGTINSLNEKNIHLFIPCYTIGVLYGSDCGCCGNYSTYCLLCSLACLYHDRACQTCIPLWKCLWGCIPSVCKN